MLASFWCQAGSRHVNIPVCAGLLQKKAQTVPCSFDKGAKRPKFLQRQLQLLRHTGGTEERDLHWAGGEGGLHARACTVQAGPGHYFSILVDKAGNAGGVQATASTFDVHNLASAAAGAFPARKAVKRQQLARL